MRLVVGAIGAVIGFYLGGPVGAFQGFALAYGVSAGLDPNQKVRGPRLDDLKAPAASYGAPIAYIEGAPRLAGCIVYASEKREIAHESTQGKGGPGVDSTTFTYEIDVLYVMAINSCSAVVRVFSNGKLVWSEDTDADEETILASQATPSWRDLRFYDGNPDQLPDPTYEAAVGVGNAPAYRGRTTIFIEGLNLGNSGQLPILTFEVTSEGTPTVAEAALVSVLQDRSYAMGTPAMSMDGFTLITGVWDAGLSQMTTYAVYMVDVDGELTFISYFDTPGDQPYTAAQGSTDTSVLMVCDQGLQIYYSALDQGGNLWYNCGDAGGTNAAESARFCRRGDYVVFGGPNGSFANKLMRFNVGGGNPAAFSLPTARGCASIAIGGAYVYSLASGAPAEDEIYMLNLMDLTMIGSIATPVNGTAGHVICGSDDALYYVHSGSGGEAYKYDGISAWTLVASNLGNAAGSNGKSSYSITDDGRFMSFFFDGSSGPATVYYAANRVEIVRPTLADVVSRLCLSTGQLTAGDIDVTALDDVVIGDAQVWAMAVSQVSTRRVVLEMLMSAYLFECVEGEKLVFVPRGGNSVATIPYADMGISDNGDVEPLPRKRLNDIEIPASVTVRYANVLNDFQDGAETGERLVTESTGVNVVELPIGLRPADAKKIADVATMDAAVSLMQIGPVSLPPAYAHLEPTDVIALTAADGSTFRCRIVKATRSGAVSTFDLVLDDATVINSEASTDDDYASSNLVRSAAASILRVLDVAPLRAVDGAPGEYFAVSATGTWPGAEVSNSPDDVTFTKIGDATSRAVFGSAVDVLGDWTGGNVFDEVNTVTVSVIGEGTLSSTTRETILSAGTANALLIGDEIVQFTTATLDSPGVYTLSGFLRALRGTEAHTGTHAIGDRVVLLTETTLRRLVEDQGAVGGLKYWKAVTIGKTRDSATSQAVTYEGVGLLPFAPVDIRLDEADGGIVTWHRRDRLFSRFLAEGTDPPMSEATESYDYELRDGSMVLIDSGTLSEPEYPVTSLFGGQFLSSMWGMKPIAAGWFAIRDDFVDAYATGQQLVVLDADFSQVEQIAALSVGRITQYVENDPDAYLLVNTYYPGTPVTTNTTSVLLYTVGSLGAGPVATHTASAAGIYGGICFDGVNAWVSERAVTPVDLLRKLNPTTLVSVATYNLTPGDYPGALFYRSGKIWVACGNGDVVRFDVAGLAEDLRITVAGDIGVPVDVFDNGTLLVVSGSSKIGAYDRATGALLYVHDALPLTYLPQRILAEHLGYIVMAVYSTNPAHPGNRVLLIDDATGEGQFLRPPDDYLYAAAGSDGTSLYLTAGPVSGGSPQTRAYVLAAPDLSGFSFTVWQKSAAVGRGYPGTATFP